MIKFGFVGKCFDGFVKGFCWACYGFVINFGILENALVGSWWFPVFVLDGFVTGFGWVCDGLLAKAGILENALMGL